MHLLSTLPNPVPAGVRTFLLAGWILPAFVSGPVQAQKLEWARQAGGTGYQETSGMAIDPQGNVLVIGTYQGATVFEPGGSSLGNAGIFDAYFAKYDAAGNVLWANRAGGTGVDLGYGIAADEAGNVYIAGNFTGTADFDPGAGTENLTSNGNMDAFLAKYTPAGELLWAIRMGGTQFEEGRCVTVDGSGNVVVAGVFSDVADFDPGPGTANLQAVGINDMYFAKFKPSGELMWAKQLGGADSERVLGLTTGISDHIYITGHFQGTVDFDPSGATNNRNVVGDSDVFFAHYDDAGDLVWAKSVGGFFYEEARGIAVDRFGNTYLTGRYGETVDFDPGPGVSELTNAGINDAFFAKYDAVGDLVWAKRVGGEANDIGNGIAVDTLGQVFLSGQYMGTVDFDPDAGTSDLTAAGDIEIFLAQYDASGNFRWAQSIGGTQMEESTVIAVDANQNVCIAGYFEGTAEFAPVPNAHNLTSAGEEDGFIAKYSTTATAIHDVTTLDARAYPLPAADVLFLELPQHAGVFHCAVFDPAGKMVLEQNGEGERLMLDLSGVEGGAYFLRIWTEQGVKGMAIEVAR